MRFQTKKTIKDIFLGLLRLAFYIFLILLLKIIIELIKF